MWEKEQGTLVSCIYCQVLNPEIDNSQCPRCQGKLKYFKPARMMDQSSASKNFLYRLKKVFEMYPDILNLNNDEITRKTKKNYLSVLENLVLHFTIYQYDIKEALIRLYMQIKNLQPENDDD